ncbi:uncharacterized protein [Palaemon carinicauda]|uniref:uncharacterized protein isoform X2 n=1 Tax=Palaemon carinicauda TaxID=392227 RepID=UPI0035B66249
MRPTHFKAAIFLLVLVAPTRPMVDQSGGGRFGKIMAPPPMPKEEAPPLTAVSDSPAEETSLEEELDEDDDHAASERKPARSWDARVRDISAKLLERFTSDLGSTTSSVAKAFGRASSALQGLQLPATGFITTLVAVIVGSSPIARTSGMYILSRIFWYMEDILAHFGGYGLRDRYNPDIGDPLTGYPIYKPRRGEDGTENATDYYRPLNFTEEDYYNASSPGYL